MRVYFLIGVKRCRRNYFLTIKEKVPKGLFLHHYRSWLKLIPSGTNAFTSWAAPLLPDASSREATTYDFQ
jgi:hypothetical protein